MGGLGAGAQPGSLPRRGPRANLPRGGDRLGLRNQSRGLGFHGLQGRKAGVPRCACCTETRTPALVRVMLMEPQVVHAKCSMPFSLDTAPFAGCEPQGPQTQQSGDHAPQSDNIHPTNGITLRLTRDSRRQALWQTENITVGSPLRDRFRAVEFM